MDDEINECELLSVKWGECEWDCRWASWLQTGCGGCRN